MEDIPIMQKTVLKPSKIPNLRDNWLDYEIESCHDCKGSLFYIKGTKGIVYDRGILNGKISNGNIYMHFEVGDVGFYSVCAECGASNTYLTKVDDEWVVEEFREYRNIEYIEDSLKVVSGRDKDPRSHILKEAERLKKKLDEWIA